MLFSIFFILSASNLFAQITLKASHQFPGGKGDARDEIMDLFAKRVKKANVGVIIQVYPI
jgi:TRAP-type C4-dicarboxylate transport system substrate-binding protein